MANAEQLAILKQGVDVWNKWREGNSEAKIDLSEADLTHADLIFAQLSRANLNGADLGEAILYEAILIHANLTGADLSRANLNGANLSGADLSGADLNGAGLGEANLSHAVLIRANLSASKIGGANFANLDLSQTIGLEEAVYYFSSTIGTDTLQRSQGKIPEVFLRGCGLSDWEIQSVKLYNPDLSNDEFINIQNRIFDLRSRQAIQISPLFISYSHANSDFVNRLGDRLTKIGIRYWRDIHDMKAGRMEKQIDRAIRQNPTVLLVLSQHSLSSDWVEHEVRTARALEKELGRDVLCPVALDASWKSSHWPKRIVEQIMEYNILDFSTWRDGSKFDGIFHKLIDGLGLFYKG